MQFHAVPCNSSSSNPVVLAVPVVPMVSVVLIPAVLVIPAVPAVPVPKSSAVLCSSDAVQISVWNRIEPQ